MVMWSAFRTTFLCLRTATASFSLNSSSTTVTRRTTRCSHFFTSIAGCDSSPAVEKQFNEFRHHLDEIESIRDRIRDVASNIDSTRRILDSDIRFHLLSRPIPVIMENAKSQIDALKQLFSGLAVIVGESRGRYYRYHGDWRTEAQHTVSLLCFMNWLETGSLLQHTEVEEKLGLNALECGLDVEDYLVGLCFMSNELATYAVDRATADDYDCLEKGMMFLRNLNASFLNVCYKNDFLYRKLDGLENDLRKVTDAYYDMKLEYLRSESMKNRDLISKGG